MFELADMKMAVYDPETLKKVGIVNKYSMLDYTLSFSGVGNFNLNCALTAENSDMLKRDRVIIFDDDIAGIVEYIERDATKDGVLAIKGSMMAGMLSYRVVLPKYEKYDFPEMIMCDIVNEYCTKGERKFNLLEVEMPLNTWSENKITYQKTGGSVSDAIQSLSETYNIGYNVSVEIKDDIKTGARTKRYVFKVYKGKDRTLGNKINKTALFGFGFNNILSSDYIYNSQSYRNYAIVAGEGEGEERKTVDVYDPIKVPNYYEVKNEIKNEGFEDGTEEWELTDLSIFDIVEEYTFRGRKALRMYGNLGKGYATGQEWARPKASKDIVPGHTYYCTAAMRFLMPVTAPTEEEAAKLEEPIPVFKLGQETAYLSLKDGFTVGVVNLLRLGPYTVTEADATEGLKVGFPLVDGLQINTELVIDTVVLTDLSEAFGNNPIPDADWCKANIPVDMVHGAASTVTVYTYEVPTGFKRREVYVDARDIQQLTEPLPDMPIAQSMSMREFVDEEYYDMLRQRGKEKLSDDYRAIESYKSEIRNDEKAAYIFGRDFYLGDKVTVIDDELSLRLDAVVTGVTITAFSGGRTIEPTFGFEAPTVYQQIKKGVI